MSEYDSEPVRGLPEALPPGETILWQGAPDWKNVAQRTMHVRSFTVYFALLLAWYAGSNIARQTPAAQVLLSTGKLTLCAVLAVGLLAFFAWMVGRTTLYTVTNKRLVIRCGIALPMILNIPFSRVASADFKACRDGSGDIVLSLTKENRIAYLALWPHARPWRLAHAQPMLRGIQEASIAAQVLGRALAAGGIGACQASAGKRPGRRAHPATRRVHPRRWHRGPFRCKRIPSSCRPLPPRTASWRCGR